MNIKHEFDVLKEKKEKTNQEGKKQKSLITMMKLINIKKQMNSCRKKLMKCKLPTKSKMIQA
jgi:hypothetical protein